MRTVFSRWCREHSYEGAAESLERDWERMVTFYDFPLEHWRHIRTTNPVESPVRLHLGSGPTRPNATRGWIGR